VFLPTVTMPLIVFAMLQWGTMGCDLVSQNLVAYRKSNLNYGPIIGGQVISTDIIVKGVNKNRLKLTFLLKTTDPGDY